MLVPPPHSLVVCIGEKDEEGKRARGGGRREMGDNETRDERLETGDREAGSGRQETGDRETRDMETGSETGDKERREKRETG